MKMWTIVPAIGLGIALTLGLSVREDRIDALSNVVVIRVAEVTSSDRMSDACVYSPEAAGAGETPQCDLGAVVARPTADERTVVWPDDFIRAAGRTAIYAWKSAVYVVGSIYRLAEEIIA